MQKQISKPLSTLRWLGTKAFIVNTTVCGSAAGYFLIARDYPVMALILIVWLLSLITFAEFRAVITN